MLDSETFSLHQSDIRTPLFSVDLLKKYALLALHVIAEEGRDPGLGGCPKVQSGKVKAKLGRRMKVRLLAPLVKAMSAIQMRANDKSWPSVPAKC